MRILSVHRKLSILERYSDGDVQLYSHAITTLFALVFTIFIEHTYTKNDTRGHEGLQSGNG